MKNIQIKTVMIPISKYATIRETDTLYRVFEVLDEHGRSSAGRSHRDAVVVDESGRFKGKITMIDIFKALEPSYRQLTRESGREILDNREILKTVKEFNLWNEPIKNLCERGCDIQVSEIMHVPGPHEYINEEDSLEKALHAYVMGEHQPLIVKNEDKVTGMLRFGDLFEAIKNKMLACPISTDAP